MSGQLNELRLQVERLNYDSKESGITIDILKEQNEDAKAELEELKKTISDLRSSQKDASIDDKEKRKQEKMAMMMAKFDTVSFLRLSFLISHQCCSSPRSVRFRLGRSPQLRCQIPTFVPLFSALAAMSVTTPLPFVPFVIPSVVFDCAFTDYPCHQKQQGTFSEKDEQLRAILAKLDVIDDETGVSGLTVEDVTALRRQLHDGQNLIRETLDRLRQSQEESEMNARRRDEIETRLAGLETEYEELIGESVDKAFLDQC